MFKFFFFIFLTIIINKSNCQITGYIKDVNEKPILNASVFLRKEDGIIIAFQKSDSLGYFSFYNKLPIVNTLLLLCASHLNYKATCISIDKRKSYELILLKTIDTLNEIIVKNKINPILQVGDSTKYNISKFIDGTEKKLEDILKKLPGINVDENGTLLFNGKKIDKVLLDGQDFFAKDYKVLTKSLSANTVNDISAIENYEEEELLSNVKKGNETILNIGLKKHLKLKLFGNASFGGGTNKDWLLENNFFTLRGTNKIAIINNYNNYGYDISPNISEQLELKSIFPKSIFFASNRNLPIIPISNTFTNFETNRDIWSTPKSSALQYNTKIGNKILVKSYSIKKTNELNEFQETNTQIINTNLNFIDSGNQFANTFYYSTKNDIEYRLDSTSKLKLSLQLSSNNLKTGNIFRTSFQNFNFNSDYLQQNANNNVLSKLTYIKKINLNTAIELNYLVAKNCNQLSISSNTQRFNSLLNLGVLDGILLNKVNLIDNYKFASFTFYKRLKNHKISLNTNHLSQSNTLNSYFNFFDKTSNSTITIDSNLFKNNINVNCATNWLEAKHEFKMNRLYTELSITLIDNNINLTSILPYFRNENFKTVKFLPSFLVGLRFNKYSKFGFVYKEYLIFDDITRFNNGFVQNNINTFSKNETFNITSLVKEAAITFQYNNFLDKGLIITSTMGISKNSNPFFFDGLFKGTNFIKNTKYSFQPRQDFFVISSIDKFINSIKSTIKFNTSLNLSKGYDNIGITDFEYNRLVQFNLNFGIRSGFKGMFNFFTNFSFFYNSQNIYIKNNIIQQTLINRNIGIKQYLFVKVNNKLHGYFAYDLTAINSIGQKNLTTFGEFRISFNPTKSKISYSLFARNIFKNNLLFTNNITSQFILIYQRQLLPRTLIFSMNFTL